LTRLELQVIPVAELLNANQQPRVGDAGALVVINEALGHRAIISSPGFHLALIRNPHDRMVES
jgi:hypothetical protein